MPFRQAPLLLHRFVYLAKLTQLLDSTVRSLTQKHSLCLGTKWKQQKAQPQKAHLSRTYSMPERLLTKKRGLSSSLPAHSRVSEEDLVSRLQCLQNDVTNFHILLADGECTLQEQKEINEGLKDEFNIIKDEFKSLEKNGSRNRAYSTNSK